MLGPGDEATRTVVLLLWCVSFRRLFLAHEIRNAIITAQLPIISAAPIPMAIDSNGVKENIVLLRGFCSTLKFKTKNYF